MDSQYKIKASFTGIENVIGGMKRIEQQIRVNTAALREQQQVSAQTGRVGAQGQRLAQQGSQQQVQNNRQQSTFQRQHHTALQRTLDVNERLYRFGREARYAWREQTESLRVYTDEAMRLNQAQQKFKAIGLSPEDNERAFQAVKQTVNTIKGLKAADVMATLTDVYTALGDLGHGIEALPLAAKFRFGFQTLFGEQFSPEELDQQVQNAMKYLEVTGAVAKGRGEMEARFNVMAQLMGATGGRVRPSDLLVMARRAGPAAQGLSIEGMRNLSTAIPELGGTGTGTSMMSLYQAIIGGVMKQSAAVEFQRLGLLDPRKIEYGRAQKLKKLLPGANKLGDLLMEDPLKAADALMEAMRRPLRGAPIDTDNANKVRQEMAILFGNRTAQRLMTMLTTQRGQVIKEARISEGAKNIEQLYAQALETPMGKMQQFEAVLANLRSEIGGPLLTALTNLATAAMPFLKFAAAHPQLALTALMTFKLAQGISSIAAIGQSAGIARLALQTQSVAVQTERAAKSTSLWRRQLGGIPSTLGTIVTLTLATAVTGYLMKLKDEAEQAWEEAKGVQREGRRAYVKLLGSPEVPTETVEKIGREDVKTGVSEMLRQFRTPEWWRPMLLGRHGTVRPLASVPEPEIAEKLSAQMPSLGLGGQFGEFVKRIRYESGLGFSESGKIERAARSAFPTSAQRFDKALSEAGGDLSAAIKKLIAEDRDAAQRVLESSSKLSESLQSGADAVEAFGRRVRSTRLPGEPEPEVGGPEAAHARGGLTRRRHVAVVGERPELILPLSQLESVLGGGRGARGGAGPVNINIDARGAQAGVGAEIKHAVLEAIRETGLDGLTDDGFRNRTLAI